MPPARGIPTGGVQGAHKSFRDILETFHIVEDMDPKHIRQIEPEPAASAAPVPAATAVDDAAAALPARAPETQALGSSLLGAVKCVQSLLLGAM